MMVMSAMVDGIADSSIKDKGLVMKMLSYADSNHDKQNQNLLCYHYTIRQATVYDSRCIK